jgi:hypothetical protein
MTKLIASLALVLIAAPAIAGDFFSQPERLCRILDSEGLQTQGWRPSTSFPGEFLCMTSLVSFGPEGPSGMASNIAFYVNGKQRDRADDVIIKVNINNPQTRKLAFQKLRAATNTFFKSIGEKTPPQLNRALTNEKPVSIEITFGKAELIHDPGRIDSYKIVLTDKAFLLKEKAAISASAEDFKKCKSVVAQAIGYEVSSLKGDGKPIQEQSYKSFMLEGRNKDLFFCEVYQGGKYRIRAALGGKFPFKLLAEGNF